MTQQKIVERKLVDDGFVTRNWALQNYISRLGAIINKLRREGWEISAGEYVTTRTGKDFKYSLINGKLKKVAYRDMEGNVLAVRYELL